MTVEELFSNLEEKYGEEFDWHLIPLTNQFFVSELKREIGMNHFLYHAKLWVVAKCDSNDDILFVTSDDDHKDIYYLFHLTYSDHDIEGYPRYKKFIGIDEVRKYMEKVYEN